MKRPHSPTRMPSQSVDAPVTQSRRSVTPPRMSFDEICVQNDFRQTKKDLLEVIVDLDKAEHSLSSLLGQLRNPKNPLAYQLKAQRFQLKMKIEKLRKTYYKLKSRVYLVDKEMKSLSKRKNDPSIEEGEISGVEIKLEERCSDDSGLHQQKRART